VMLDIASAEPALRDELLFKISPFIMHQSDLLAQALTGTYLEELRQRSHWRDRVRHELCGILYADPDDTEGFRERALALGLDPSAPHLALALRLPDLKAAADEQQAELEAALGAAGRVLGCEPESLLRTLRPGHLLLWLPVPVGEPATAQERGIAARAAAIAAAGCGVDAVGVGLAETGAAGWRRSGEQALNAIEIGRHFQADGRPEERVFLYSDVAVEHAAMESPVLARLLGEQLQGMSAEPMLLETLQAWCEHGPHRKVVADVLRIHPNSLAYRIERIEALLGERLDDPRRMARWLLALRLRRLSLRPASAQASVDARPAPRRRGRG
jgi:carbohydrate diacid regulator